MDGVTAPVIACSRHRLATDGQGVTTLVCFHGCPLRCRYCINPFSYAPETRRQIMSAQALYQQVRQDELYFIATGGGVTFGGGEPLLYPAFIREFRSFAGEGWNLCAETSLNVPWDHVYSAAYAIDHFYIDCKDTNPDIYRRYTGKDNHQMLKNLEQLVELKGSDCLTVRLPLIPDFNTEEDRQRSKAILQELGIKRFDMFTYQVRNCK